MRIQSLKKIASVAMAGALILSTTGCLDFGKSKQQVLELADTVASDMASANASALIKNSTLDKKDKNAEALTELLGEDLYDDDQKAFFKAVEGTIEYEVDEESVEVNKDEASVDVVFTIVDYAKVLEEEFTSIDELTSAIKKGDTKELTITLQFAKVDKEWLADNVGDKKFNKLYDYRGATFQLALTSDMIADMIDTSTSDFWLTTAGVYYDTTFVEYDLYFNSVVYDYYDRGEYIYYKVLADGSLIYTSGDYRLGESTLIECYVDLDMCADMGKDEVFPEGNYTVEIYTADGELIHSASVSVEKSDPTPTPTSGGGGGGFTGEGDYFQFMDTDFRDKYVLNAEWFDYNGYMTGDAEYSTDVDIIAFSFEVTSDCDEYLEYNYYYSPSADESDLSAALESPVYTSTCYPNSYANGDFYDFDYYVWGDAQPGYYIIIVNYADSGDSIFLGLCEVR